MLKLLAQYRAASNAAPYSQEPSVNQEESSSAQTNQKVPAATLAAKNRKKNATIVAQTPTSLNAQPKASTNKPEKGVKKGVAQQSVIAAATKKGVKPQIPLSLRQKLSNTRHKALEKKKDLSVNLLYKTNLSYVKAILRRKNYILEDNFTAYMRQPKSRSIFSNNFLFNNYNITANRDINLLLNSNLKKIRTSAAAEPVA